MAGYMRRLNGYVYDGSHVAAQNLTNGMFVMLNTDGKVVPLPAPGGNATYYSVMMRVVEKTTLFGKPAVVCEVIMGEMGGLYFVENVFDNSADANYDESEYVIPAGAYVRMHQPVINDQLILTTNIEVDVGDIVAPTTGGAIVVANS